MCVWEGWGAPDASALLLTAGQTHRRLWLGWHQADHKEQGAAKTLAGVSLGTPSELSGPLRGLEEEQ